MRESKCVKELLRESLNQSQLKMTVSNRDEGRERATDGSVDRSLKGHPLPPFLFGGHFSYCSSLIHPQAPLSYTISPLLSSLSLSSLSLFSLFFSVQSFKNPGSLV